MNSGRPLDDADFQTMLLRAAECIDQSVRARAAVEQLEAWAARLQAEAETLAADVDEARHDAETSRAELAYWRSRAGLMLRALRHWQSFHSAHAAQAPSEARAYGAALAATKEAMAAISPAGIQ